MEHTALDQQDWSKPGVYPVADDTYRIPLSMPNNGLRAVNVYLISDGDSHALVDAGWSTDTSYAELTTALSTLGLRIGDLETVMVTHVHHDHYSLAMRIRRESGCKVMLGRGEEGTLTRVLEGTGRSLEAQRSRLALCGAGEELVALDTMVADGDPRAWVTDEFEPPDVWLDESEVVRVGRRSILSVPTPGHTRGHLCFLDRDARLAFTGDHVLPHITPSVGFEAVTNLQSLQDYLSSLRLSRTWGDLRLMPAHGPAEGAVGVRAAELLKHHEARLDEIAETTRLDGPLSVYDIASRISWTGRRRPYEQLDEFNRIMACLETLVHVELLDARNVVVLDRTTGLAERVPA